MRVSALGLELLLDARDRFTEALCSSTQSSKYVEAHNLSGIAVRVPEMAWWQRRTLEVMDPQA